MNNLANIACSNKTMATFKSFFELKVIPALYVVVSFMKKLIAIPIKSANTLAPMI